jgi:hypothetical protein
VKRIGTGLRVRTRAQVETKTRCLMHILRAAFDPKGRIFDTSSLSA